MFVVIAYDISDDRRRDRVMRLLKDYGQRVQYSVFECDLTQRQYAQLRGRLRRRLRGEEDSVRYYALCLGCKAAVETANSPPVATSPPYYLI